MVATRQDAWTEDDDLLLAEVTLRHIREGSTQLSAFEEVGYRLGRTAAACGFRWNSAIRKKYESAIQIAKAQRQQKKSRGKHSYIANQNQYDSTRAYDSAKSYATETESSAMDTASISNRLKEYGDRNGNYQMQLSEDDYTEQNNNSNRNSSTEGFLMNKELQFDDVIRFLKSQRENFKSSKYINNELKEKEQEIERLRDENKQMKLELRTVQQEYDSMHDDYKALMKIMDRARKLAFLNEDSAEDKVSFKMDKNGNLERVEKS